MSDTLFSKKYTVHHVLKSNQYMNIFVGETKQQTSQKVLINQWTDKTLIQQWLATLLEMKQKNDTDFIDCFAESGKLYTVFCYKEGKNLLQYVQSEKLALHYRVVLLQTVLQAFLNYQHYNNMLQYCMLQYPNIIIQNNAIYFNYQLLLLPEQKQINCFEALEQTMKILFTNEELKSMSKLLIVMQKCQKKIYQYLGEVIKDLQDVSGAVEKEKSIKLYIAEKKKKNKKKFVIFLAFLTIAGMIYIAYDAYKKNAEDTFLYTELKQLGTVEITTQEQQEQKQDSTVEVIQKQQQIPQQTQLPQSEHTEQIPQIEQSKTYTVKVGNNLTMICMQYYGDIGYLQSLADYNHITNINLIYPGQVLTLPPKQQLQKIPVRTYGVNPKKPITKEIQKQNAVQQQNEQNNENMQYDENMEGYTLLLEEENYYEMDI